MGGVVGVHPPKLGRILASENRAGYGSSHNFYQWDASNGFKTGSMWPVDQIWHVRLTWSAGVIPSAVSLGGCDPDASPVRTIHDSAEWLIVGSVGRVAVLLTLLPGTILPWS